MKYSVETTDTGYVEKLHINNKEYIKRWERTEWGTKCFDDEFWEQIEADGVTNEDILDVIAEYLDGSNIGYDLYCEVKEVIGEVF